MASNVLPFKQTADYYFNKAETFCDSGKLLDALHYYRRAVSMEPGNIEYVMPLSMTLTEMGCFKESNDVLISFFCRDATLSPADVLYGMGCNFAGLYDIEKAKYCFESFMGTVDPDSLPETVVEDVTDIMDSFSIEDSSPLEILGKEVSKARDIAVKGTQNLSRGKFRNAVADFRKACELDKSNNTLKNALALALYSDGNYEESYEIVSQVLLKEPANLQANCAMALIAQKRGEHDKQLQS